MAALRARRSMEEREYDKIVNRMRMRNKRKPHTGKGHLEGNLKAKKGMKLLISEGPLMEFSRRETMAGKAVKGDELFEWELFKQKSKGHSETLSKHQPDMYQN